MSTYTKAKELLDAEFNALISKKEEMQRLNQQEIMKLSEYCMFY